MSAAQERKYLDKLKDRVDADASNLRALVQEFRQEHGLEIRPATNRELTVALALPARDLVDAGTTKRVVFVLGHKGPRGGSLVAGTGQPLVGPGAKPRHGGSLYALLGLGHPRGAS